MLRDGADLTQPLTEHETIALACSQRGAMVESSESPYLSGESVNDDLNELKNLIKWVKEVGVKHIIASTGRFKKETLEKIVLRIRESRFVEEAEEVNKNYCYEQQGYYRLPLEKRISFHKRLKEIVEGSGLTYTVCQELAWNRGIDTATLKTCHGVENMYIMMKIDKKFVPLCNLNCVRCSLVSCGNRMLRSFPLKFNKLRIKS